MVFIDTAGDPGQRQWINALFLAAAIYVIVKGATAQDFVLKPRRSGGGPITFKPQWYHRLLIVFVGLCVGIMSLLSLLGSHWVRH